MYKIKKKNIWVGNIYKLFFSYWLCLFIVYLLGFFFLEINIIVALVVGRGDKKLWKC